MTTTLHRLPDGSIAEFTDAQWEECVREGFTNRDAGAWWLLHALPNLCSGNRVQLMHDYPQRYEHLLAASAGRVIEVTPTLAVVDGHLEVIGMRGDTWNVEIYGEQRDDGTTTPIAHSGQVVGTIDSAQGVGKTNSIVLFTDVQDRRPLACFWDNTILHDDLARVAADGAAFFRSTDKAKRDHVTLVCEADGAGRHTAHELNFLGVPHHLFWQGKDGNAEKCITQAKRRIEARPYGAPLVMQEECDELQRDEKNQLKGRKDCLMMYGLANVWIDQHPYVHAPDPEARKDRLNRMHFEEALKQHIAQERVKAPRWGR